MIQKNVVSFSTSINSQKKIKKKLMLKHNSNKKLKDKENHEGLGDKEK